MLVAMQHHIHIPIKAYPPPMSGAPGTKKDTIMSTKSIDSALDFMPSDEGRPSRLARIKEYFAAVKDGLAAWREYERLTANGVAHEVAARKSFEKHFPG
jgi:hypothetical protein